MHSVLLPLCYECWHPCLRGMSRLPLALLSLWWFWLPFPCVLPCSCPWCLCGTVTSLSQVLIITCKWRLIFLCILAWSKGFKEINSANSTLNQIKFKAPITAFQLASQSVRCRPRCSPAQARTLVTAQEQTAQSTAWGRRSQKPSGCMFHDVGHNSPVLACISYNFAISSFYFFSCLVCCFALQRC